MNPEESTPVSKTTAPQISTLLDDAWALYKSHFKIFFPVSLIIIAVSLLQEAALRSGSVPFLLLSILVVLIVVFLSQIVFILIISDRDGEEHSTLGVMYKKAWDLIIPYGTVAGLTMLAVIGGGVMLIIPGFIVAILLTFAVYIFILEGKRGMEALIDSWNMVRHRWWAVFTRMFVFALVLGVLSLIVGFIVFMIRINYYGSLDTALIAIKDNTEPAFFGFAQTLVSAIFMTPFSITFFYLLYASFREQTLPVEGVERVKIRKNILAFIIVGIAALVIGSAFASATIARYLPGAFQTGSMPASAVYSLFL